MHGRIWIPAGAMVMAGMLVLLTRVPSSELKPDPRFIRLSGPAGFSSEQSEDQPGLPEAWVASAEDVAKTTFEATLPETSGANSTSATAYFLSPDFGVLAVAYPPADTPTSVVRQNYIMVYESSWGREEPLAVFRQWLTESKFEGSSIMDLDGVPVVSVRAHSTSDDTGENPSLLWFVVNGTEFQVSGGDNADDLIAIANDIITRATPTD